MACRGVHFALDQATVDRLLACPSEDDRLNMIQAEIEEEYFIKHKDLLAETDKAWDWIHRTVTDGTLVWDEGDDKDYPLDHLILGGEWLYEKADYIISLKTPQQVADVAVTILPITEATFRKGFSQIDGSALEQDGDEDLEYAWYWFERLREFWMRAAAGGRYVLFSVDQ